MKNLKFILIVSLVFIGYANAENVKIENTDGHFITEMSQNENINPELIQMLKSGEIKSLNIYYSNEFSCTISAEISYNGAAIKLSITAETCEKAGAGLAQAVRGFMNEVKKK